MSQRTRPAFAALTTALTFASLALGACGSDSPTDGAPRPAGALRLSVDTDRSGNAISLAPKAGTIALGQGLILKAQIVDAAGQPIPGASAEWSSTDNAVARVTKMADSGLVSDHGRAVVTSIATGTAKIVAKYEDVADTATVTIVPRPGGGTPGTPAERAREFDLTVRVQGVLQTNAAGDSASRHQVLPGSTVTVTLLPLRQGDSVATGTTPVTAPTVVGTKTADANGTVVFPKLTVSRYRIEVQPPAGSTWMAATNEYSPPYWGQVANEVWLRRP